jgi:hypothetical protein
MTWKYVIIWVKKNVIIDVLAKDSYAKKVRMTLQSACEWNSSNDTRVIKLVNNKSTLE